MTTLVQAHHQSDILASLRRLKGRGTVGDVVADSGLPSDDVRAGLKSLLQSHKGHLAVTESGELLYDFDPRLIERGTEPFLARARETFTKAVTKGFKAWIVVMLVVYFAVFVALVIAAIVAGRRGEGGGGGRGGWGGGRGHGGGGFPNFWFWYWVWGPRWRIGRPYYGHRWERTLDKDDRVPFYKKVFAFVFGPDKPEPTSRQLDRAKLRLIRARNGVLTTAELVEHTGSDLDQAEDEMGRLLGAYDGEAAVSPDGELVYAFPDLVTSANAERAPRAPNPAWLRLEYPQDLTGNSPGANAAVIGMNAFTLTAAATAPWFIFPRLGIGGTAAFIGLVLVPVVFSVLFFAGPLARMVGVARENRRRSKRNVRKVVLGLVYERSLSGGKAISVDEAHAHVRRRLKKTAVSESAVRAAVEELAAEFEADVVTDEDGTIRYDFQAIRSQYAASESMRSRLRLDRRELGDVVFSTSDDAEESGERDLALFDKELEAGDADLTRFLPPSDRVSYEDDYELVAFDEELARARGK